jgi:hypothetical protein
MEESELFYTVQSGFRINAREGTVRYTVTLEPRGEFFGPIRLVTRFQNPADPETPLVAEQIVPPQTDYVFLDSEPLTHLHAERVYRIDIDIFTDPEAEEPDDRHTIYLRSIITTRH